MFALLSSGITLVVRAALVCSLLLGWERGSAFGQQFTEYEVKSAFILNFLKLAEFPSVAAPGDPFEICVFVNSEVAHSFEALSGKSVERHPVEVRFDPKPGSLRSCSVLFEGRAPEPKLDLRALGASGILTVGEAEDFLTRGGQVRFYQESNKIRFEIAMQAVALSRIRLSSKLRSVARVLR